MKKKKHPVCPSHDIHLTFPKIIHDVDCQAQMYVIFLLLCEDKENHEHIHSPNDMEMFLYQMKGKHLSTKLKRKIFLPQSRERESNTK